MTARAALGGVILLGAMLRLMPVLGSEFPLNDGGLFLTMARDLRADDFALPMVATYNGLEIPFAYPPLGFYLIALSEAAGLNGLDVLRWVPAAASIATIPVVYAIGRELFRSASMGLATAAFFAVSTGSYEWLVLGGGVTRAPGFLLALLAVFCAVKAYREPGWRWPVAAGLALGATGLWHPQAAVFAALSTLVLLPFVAGDWRVGLRRLVFMGAVGAPVVAPWLAVIVGRHGLEPLGSAVSSGGTPFVGLFAILASRTSGGAFEVLGIATSLALAITILRGWWLPVAWMVVIMAFDSRAGQPYVALPAALAVAFALRDVAAVLGRRVDRGGRGPKSAALASGAPILIGALFFIGAFADSLIAQTSADSPLRSLTRPEREAMAWVSANTERDANFTVVSGRYWAMDAAAEWFPVLADRRSVATVQGYEWLGADRFSQQVDLASSLAPCVATGNLRCVEDWFDEVGDVDYLVLTRSAEATAAGLGCCHVLAQQMERIRPIEVVYRDEAVVIVRLLQ